MTANVFDETGLVGVVMRPKDGSADLIASVASVLREATEIPGEPVEQNYRQALRQVRRNLITHSYQRTGEVLDTIAERGRGD